MKTKVMPIIRSDVEDAIKNNIEKSIFFLCGEKGSGKSYIADAASKNFLHKNKKKYKNVITIKCYSKKSKEKENQEQQVFSFNQQIYDYNSFISVMLLKTEAMSKYSPSFPFEKKVNTLQTFLQNSKEKKFIFIIDDLDRIDDFKHQSCIVSFFEKLNIKHPVIITYTEEKKLNKIAKNNEYYSKVLGKINKIEFQQICAKYINIVIENTEFKNKILQIRKSIGNEDFYNFIKDISSDDLCLMKDILHYLVIKIFDREEIKSDEIKNNFLRIKNDCTENKFKRNSLANYLLQKLGFEEKRFLYAIALFETPVEKSTLEYILEISDTEIKKVEEKLYELYFFEGFLKIENNKYMMLSPLKYLLYNEFIEKIHNDTDIEKLKNNWINFTKEITKAFSEKIDNDLSVLDEMAGNFDNISRVLNFLYKEETLESWNDYYEISDNIWYFAEITGKDINEYHYKRFEIAEKINNDKKIFDSALHYCNVSCKMEQMENSYVEKCFRVLKDLDSNSSISERLKLKYTYTMALKAYFSDHLPEAEKYFYKCENSLPNIIKNEKDDKEKKILVKDYISVIRWHSELYIKKIYNNYVAKDKDVFFDLNNKINQSIVYEIKTRLDYSRVIAPLLMNRIKLIIYFFHDEMPNYKHKLKYDFEILKTLNSTIENSDLENEYKKIKELISPYLSESIFKNSNPTDNKTLNDETQLQIIPILQETKSLLIKAIERETGKKGKVSLITMPDLGLSNNVIRMTGGFYTGMFLEWESDIPIVPIDTTINSCGVSVYLLEKEMSADDFLNSFNDVVNKIKSELDYNWNFDRGNHFITLGRIENGNYCGNYCIVMHASADEYKKDLYPPEKGKEENSTVWYKNDIKTISFKNRYLRYLSGNTASKFISKAMKLETVNHFRMNEISKCLFNDYLKEELIFIPHYGMPTSNSIAIGCSWKNDESVLLTAPGKDIYIIKPHCENKKSDDNYWLTPHGLGVSATIKDIKYKDGLYINNKRLETLSDVKEIKGRSIRCRNADEKLFEKHLTETLSKCKGETKITIHPLASISAEGSKKFE